MKSYKARRGSPHLVDSQNVPILEGFSYKNLGWGFLIMDTQ